MRVMTFNLRFENDHDGPNSWIYRRDMIVHLVHRYRPAILGTQEGRWSMLRYLESRLSGYLLHAPGRVIDDTCQYPTLFVEGSRFDIVDGDEFWLSTTPRMHRSKDWDSAFPRMVSCAKVVDRRVGRTLWAAVTHLDHIGSTARVRQAQILAAWVRKRRSPVVLMGDFNDAPGSEVHRVLTDPAVGLRDSWQVRGRAEDKSSLTHHGFDGVPQKCRMDWILLSSDFTVERVEIVRDHSGKRYPSDHFPYFADIAWNDCDGKRGSCAKGETI